MKECGTWKSEPANEDSWDVDWSIAEPDPEYISVQAWQEIYQFKSEVKRD